MIYQGSGKGGKKKKSRTGLVIVLLILALALAAGGFFALKIFTFTPGGKSGPLSFLESDKERPVPFIVSGEVRALSVNAPADISTREQCAEYFGPVLDFAQSNGLNTVILNGKNDISVFWRDKNFPSYPSITKNDQWYDKERFDPLSIFCEMAAQREIQLWLAIDPYASGGYTSDMKSPASEYANDLEGPLHTRFAPEDKKYADMLVESLSALPENYGISAIVIQGNFDNTDAGIWNTSFGGLLERLKQGWSKESSGTSLVLSFKAGMEKPLYGQGSPQGNLLSANVDVLMPELATGRGLAENLAAWNSAAPCLAVQTKEDSLGLVIFTSLDISQPKGTYFGGYEELSAPNSRLPFYESMLVKPGGSLPVGFVIEERLNVTYPVKEKLTWEGVYMTGTSNPGEPLLINGTEVEGRASNGAFGVYVPLSMGMNTFTLTNGSESFVKEIERVAPTGGGSSTPKSDGTKSLPAGTAVTITRPYVNIISDPEQDSSISEIYNQGAVAVVKDSVKVRGGTAWAYKLGSGDYIMAKNCQKIDGDGKSSFSGLTAENHEKGEYLYFDGSGTPGAYITYLEEEKTLRIAMYDTSFTLPEGFSSKLVTQAWLDTNENGAVLLFLKTENMWGYNIEYENGTTRLFLKEAPKLGDNPARPLEGIHVMLDPGHGQATEGANYGAVGISGDDGYPHEKDINLVLSKIIAYRLEQLGATVSYTKSDDSNPGINERYLIQVAEKPDFFLSVHHDGLDGNRDLNDSATIFGIYYHPFNIPPSKDFAQSLMDNVAAATGRTAREKPMWGGINYGVIRTTVCPSVLFEYGLIVTPDHFDGATSTDGLYEAALGTVQAIIDTIP